MLELNPNDNQGVRSILAAYLLEEERHDQLAGLLKAYKDDSSANLGYSRALLAFRQHGNSAKARKALSAAIEQNKFVPAYLRPKKASEKPSTVLFLGRRQRSRSLRGQFSKGLGADARRNRVASRSFCVCKKACRSK